MPLLELAASACTAGALAGTWVNAALRPESQLFGHTLIAGADPNEVALTYDDGPNDRSTAPLLETLDRFHARATFFMIGRFALERPDLVRQVHEAGHLVANHTMTHPWLPWLSAQRVRDEIRGCNQALEDAIGAPVHFFRPPHGARSPAVLRIARDLGLTTVQWNALGADWNAVSPEQIVAHIDTGLQRAKARHRGANVLLHDGFEEALGADRSATVAATAILLQRFQQDGTKVVTVDHWR